MILLTPSFCLSCDVTARYSESTSLSLCSPFKINFDFLDPALTLEEIDLISAQRNRKFQGSWIVSVR